MSPYESLAFRHYAQWKKNCILNGMPISKSETLEIKADANNISDKYWWTAKKECNKQCKTQHASRSPNQEELV